MKQKLIFLTTLTTLLSFSFLALADDIRLLGMTRLSFRENDLDAIRIATCPKPAYQSIQLRVKQGAADIKILLVKYANGSIDRLKVAENLRQAGRSRWIDLRGNRRCLREIAILGDTDNASARKARIEYWGRY